MKTLILSAAAGQGHNACAQAICEAYEQHGETCVVEDAFALLSPKLSASISRNHDRGYRHKPEKADANYRFLTSHPGLFAKHNVIYRVMSLGSGRIARCIREGGYDAVICTHALAAMMLTAAMERRGAAVKSAFVATDHTCSPGLNGTKLDRYFIPHPDLAPLFLSSNIPVEAMAATGIPVRRAFAPAQNKETLRERFGLKKESRHLLLMGGSMGCGPIPQLLEGIAKAMPQGWEISVVCGTNEEMYRQLAMQHEANPSVHIHGYVQQMPLLLCSADLYLTKPGGLSTAEAAAAAVPMVLVNAVGGCEVSNLRHFVKRGAAVTADSEEAIVRVCTELMRDPCRLAAMAEKLKGETAGAAEKIYQEMHAF